MKTIVEKITKEQLNTEEGKKIIGQAGDFLKEGGLVAFPTETVYGLGADALNKTASTKIYAAKGRPSDNPLIVHITNMGALDKIADIIPEVAYKVADAYWPGPLTMIFQKTEEVPYETTGGLDTVAVRMPSAVAAAPVPATPVVAAPAAEAAPVAPAAAPAANAGGSRPANWHCVTAPMVGTFYVAPAPGEAPFVQVGDEVAANQTLCIVEAMKLMNEITAEEMGTIREVCLEDATPVEFGTPLFYIEPHVNHDAIGPESA